MTDTSKKTDGPTTLDAESYDFTLIPDYDNNFVEAKDLEAFARALAGPEPSQDDFLSPSASQSNFFITALNDWRPIRQRVKKVGKRKKKRKPPLRGKDETREGFVYGLLKWPLLLIVVGWIIVLGFAYLLTRLYILLYENFITVRGKRDKLIRQMRSTVTYQDWMKVAKELDNYLGNDSWKQIDEYAYYNSNTVRNVRDEMQRLRTAVEGLNGKSTKDDEKRIIMEDLRALVETSVKNNFVGVENARLYSETYYGTKDLVQSFVDEVELVLKTLSRTDLLDQQEHAKMYKHLYTNNGRTALCLSGGATFAYYHFGVAKALLDAGVLPEVITGTSGGALVAAMLATRTDDELKRLLVPALAGRITACSESIWTWFPRWYRTGARFDSVDWAQRCGWFCHGSLTFREAYERTGRILNVTCIPSDPHSPTVLANYLTTPDCVIWSAVLASAAVPGILNPVVLMKKKRNGDLAPYSVNLKDKWKDGSLRTDVPLRALNTHFNVNFSIVSQVNPHINLFFFSSRGTVGRPVTHRRGRGWRGGFLGSATEQYLKLDLTKWLKVLRHLELLPRYMGQDWSEVWLQRFSGTITLWPRVKLSDFFHILSDPPPSRLARMIHEGQQSTFPKLKFLANRMKIERLIEAGRRSTMDAKDMDMEMQQRKIASALSEDDLHGLLADKQNKKRLKPLTMPMLQRQIEQSQSPPNMSPENSRAHSPSLSKRLSGWWTPRSPSNEDADGDGGEILNEAATSTRRNSVMAELGRQSRIFIDDDESDVDDSDANASTDESDENEYHDDDTRA